MLQRLTEWFHEWRIKDRRAQILSKNMSTLIQEKSTILDVGSGDGKIANLIQKKFNSVFIQGIDVLVRNDSAIDVTQFDGLNIPFPNQSYDYVLLIDVLHHTEHSKELLNDCIRVAKKGIIIKDHINNSRLDYWTLRFMDKVGNARYDVHLPHLYFSTDEWNTLWEELQIIPLEYTTQLKLYPFPFSILFDRNLHFITLLSK